MPARSPHELQTMVAAAVANGDLEAFMELQEPAAVHNINGDVRVGAEAIRESIAGSMGKLADFRLEVKQVVEAGDIALIHTRFGMVGPDQASGRGANVARRQPDGTWRLVIHHDLGAA